MLYATNLAEAETLTRSFSNVSPTIRLAAYLFYKLDEEMLLLFNPEATSTDNQGIQTHGTYGGDTSVFQIEEDELEAWKSRLAGLRVALELEHTWPNGTKSSLFSRSCRR